jgi:FAD:protein FMN transferase
VTRPVFVVSRPVIGTVVTIQVVGRDRDRAERLDVEAAIERAFGWFHDIEARCSRFDPASELMRLTNAPGVAVPVSAMLFEAVQFALAVAEETGGAFDPTVGHAMETRGFNREHRTGRPVRTDIETGGPVSYRDVVLDPGLKTIALLRPLVLDLGAVAKGLAVDTAARELQPFENFAVDAGGDLFLGGRNPEGAPWSVGIRHPRREGAIIDTLRVSNTAVCTSGDYERRAPGDEAGHHILDPRKSEPAAEVASVTVVAPTAMLADAVATAAFVLGPSEGLQLFERLGVEGLIVSPSLETFETPGLPHG